MKILIVTYGLNTVGGLQTWQHMFSHELIKRGHNLTIMEMYDYSNLYEEKKVVRKWDEKIKILRLNGHIIQRSINPNTTRDALKVIMNFAKKRQLSLFLKKEKFDSILFTDPNFTFHFFEKTINDNNCYVQFHSSFERFMTTSKIRYYLVKQKIKSYKKFVLLSEGDVDKAIKNGFQPEKLTYITNFINEKKFLEYRKDYSTNSKIILIVAKLVSIDKQVDHALKAFSLIDKNISKDWKIKIIGEGKIKYELIELCNKLDIRDSVEFVGQKDNPIEDFFESEFFVLSSSYEGFPLTLLECVFSNLPIISYECSPSIRTIVSDGFNGLIVDKDDIKSLADAMASLMVNSEKVKILSQNQEKIKEKFVTDNIINRWEAMFSEFANIKNITCEK